MRIALLFTFAICAVSQAQELYVVPDGVETRWASPENPAADRGRGATRNAGRKGGLGKTVPFQSVFFSSPEGRSFNASIPMPFRAIT